MATSNLAGLDPVVAFSLVGVLGVGGQWLAWRLRLPAIVLMLAAGLLIGPVLGGLDPQVQFGPMLQPMIGIAVAIILFEGGLTLKLKSLSDAATGVKRLVFVGAPLGWVSSALALHYAGGLSWAASAVFGGIMIVTGPTVIAPLLRQAKLSRRPAALLQWEAIVNDPIGALAAVLAFEVVVIVHTAAGPAHAVQQLVVGIAFATAMGVFAGWALVKAFRQGLVPEYMKVPILFVLLLAVFAVTDKVLHESGLLAVTIMGIWIANAHLPSFTELYRFKEHATVLLVSGVFILLAASMDMATLTSLDGRALVFVLVVIFVARPLPVLISLAFTNIPWRERILVAFTGPRGVVLVAVAGLFGERLGVLGIPDADRIAPLAFALVAATVVLHGFTLAPVSRLLGLTAAKRPGVLLIGGSRWSVAFAEVLQRLDIPVLIADPNHAHLRSARDAGLPTFFGDVLSELAEHNLDYIAFDHVICATDNDAYNTLVATDIAPEFGRGHVYQVKRVKDQSSRHALPTSLGGRPLGGDDTYLEANAKLSEGWAFRATPLTSEFTLDHWREQYPNGVAIAQVDAKGDMQVLGPDVAPKPIEGSVVIAFVAPDGSDQTRRSN